MNSAQSTHRTSPLRTGLALAAIFVAVFVLLVLLAGLWGGGTINVVH